MLASHAFAGVMDTKPTDRMYDCLPMYHTAGGLVATGVGAAQRRLGGDPREILRARILGRRGAARMHAVPVHRRAVPLSRAFAAAIRTRPGTACGWPAATGLRPDLWEEFKTRFRIPHILEFYGATEGNVNIFNFEGKPGAVGRVPWFVAHRFPIAVVRFDVERQQPVRNAEGFCERCDAERAGRGDRPDRQRSGAAGKPLRGLCRGQPEREQDPARRVREGRRLVPHRRPDAQGRARLFLFRRSRRRHLPLEGRERLDVRGGRSDQHLPGHRGRQCLWRDRGRPRRPRRHGGDRLRRTVRSRRAARASRAPTCRTMRGRCSCASSARST